jgi:DNA-directed RNA polymerase specialized sigma24 family protein
LTWLAASTMVAAMNDDAADLLAELADLTGQLGELRARRDTVVVEARTAGATWAQVADALGVSVQAVHKRYRDVRLDLHGRAWKEPRLPL